MGKSPGDGEKGGTEVREVWVKGVLPKLLNPRQETLFHDPDSFPFAQRVRQFFKQLSRN